MQGDGVKLRRRQANKHAEIRLANSGCVFQHGVEDRLKFAGRAGDDLEHLRGRRLLLQRLGEIVGALAQLGEQPRVLDGDHRLGGEVLHQLDLLVGERAHFAPLDGDGADQLAFPRAAERPERARACRIEDDRRRIPARR